jgi:hypothetical protein
MRASSVVVVGIDGLGAFYVRPMYDSGALQGLMPNLCAMIEEAAFASLSGRTVFPPISAPVWMAVLTGMAPDQTGIAGNEWPDDLERGFAPPPAPVVCSAVQPRIPVTLFELLAEKTQTGKGGVAFTSWKWFEKVLPAVTEKFRQSNEDDDLVVRWYLSELKDDPLPPLTFLHLDDVDETGHHTAWGSPEYFAAAAGADLRLGAVVGDVRARRAKGEDVRVIVVADHGGSEQHHGDMKQSHMEIPIVVWPADEPRGTATQQETESRRSILDVAPTVLALLGVAQPQHMRGTPLCSSRRTEVARDQ